MPKPKPNKKKITEGLPGPIISDAVVKDRLRAEGKAELADAPVRREKRGGDWLENV